MKNSLCLPGLVIALIGGCGTLPDAAPDYIDQAITSLFEPSLTCAPADYSTEEEKLLVAIKQRQFRVVEAEQLVDEEGRFVEYVLELEGDDRSMVLATVYHDGSICTKYSFSRIARD